MSTTLINDSDTASFQRIVDPLDRLLSGYRQGLLLTYNSGATISAERGEIMVANSAETIKLMLRSTVTSNVTFSNLDTGTEQASTTYYVYAGTNTASDATPTFYISASSTAPTGITYYARLGSFFNDSDSNISRINNDNIGGETGEPESKTVDVVYQALTDGYVSFTGTLLTGDQYTLDTDSANPPTVNVQQLTYNGSSQMRGNMFYKIKAGDYYKVTQELGSQPTIAYYFIPEN